MRHRCGLAWRGLACLALLVILLGAAPRAHAEVSDAQATAAARRVLIALRVLAYDKTLAERHPGEVVVVAVASTSSAAGQAERAVWLAGFALLPKVKVSGRPVRVVLLDVGGKVTIAKQLAATLAAAVIVTADVAPSLPELRTATRAAHALTVTQHESAVASGLAVGLVRGKEREEIVINLEAARAEGARFGAGLLQLARLVESAP